MKKHGKKIILLALCLALLFVAADKGYMPEDGDSADSEIILTDQAGNEVKLDAPAERIVSCYYITTYACISLGLTDRLVGIESKADKRPVYKMAAPEILELPDVGTLKEFNVEAAAAAEPDLVIMPKRLSDFAEALKALGIPVRAGKGGKPFEILRRGGKRTGRLRGGGNRNEGVHGRCFFLSENCAGGHVSGGDDS